MAINSKIEDYEQLILGLKSYRTCVQDSCQTLMVAIQLYDEGVKDRTSKIYRKKITKMCDRIDPVLLDRVDKLIKNLITQKEQLEEIEKIVSRDADDSSSFNNSRQEFMNRIQVDPVYVKPITTNNNTEDECKGQLVRDLTRDID